MQHDDLVDADGVTTPLCRARILASVLQHVARSVHPLCFEALFQMVLAEIGLTEEQASSEIMRSVFLLCDAGLITDDHFDGEGRSLTFGISNMLRPSRSITGFIWGDEVADSNSESSNGRL